MRATPAAPETAPPPTGRLRPCRDCPTLVPAAARGLPRRCPACKVKAAEVRETTTRRPHATHGLSKTLEYGVWRTMLSRCLNPRAVGWERYGGRGIRVCDRWAESFEAFLKDMGRRPHPDASLERIDNDGPYEPGNVRWATRHEQAINRRNTARATLNGETLSLVEWGERFGIRPNMIWQRLRRGIPIELAIAPPILTGRRGLKAKQRADYAAAIAAIAAPREAVGTEGASK